MSERMSERRREHNCSCCTCGTIELTWSDREVHVNPDDVEGIVTAVRHCALDHLYDSTIVPWGLPEAVRDRLLEVVSEYMRRVRPDWREHSPVLTDEEDIGLEAVIRLCVAAAVERGEIV